MIRSLYSAVSGLTSHQTKMDVIGNNIANVNTYGFKSSRAAFSDVYYQTLKAETAGNDAFAGNNPSTVGYGVQVASIDKDMSQGSFQSTNRTLDIALSGDGFFALANFSMGPNGAAPADTTSPDALTYSRAGNFGLDSFGNLVNNNNKFVMGSRNTVDGLHMIGDNSAQELGKVALEDNNGDNKITSADYTYENTINVNDLIREAYGIYTDPDTGYLYTNRAPVPVTKATTTKQTDENGVEQDVTVYDIVGFTMGEPTDPEQLYLIDKKGNYVTKETGTGAARQVGVIKYTNTDADGNTITPPTVGAMMYARPAADGTVPDPTADESDPPLATLSDAVIGEFTYKDLGSFTIGSDGVITVSYNNKIKAIARIEVTVFDNPEGLIENGDTSYSETTASGAGGVKKAGEEGAANTISKKLEMSNVNLAQEFSDMIVTQRGFQANARMVTTSDSMLEELVNLKR